MPRKASGREAFAQNVRAAVRALWTGAWDADQFTAQMYRALDEGYTRAWLEGAGDYGIKNYDDLTPPELAALAQAVDDTASYAPGFAEAIQAGNKANKGKLAPLLKRAELWIARYDELANLGRVMAGGNTPQRWTLGVAEHCSSCLKLSGKVKRASYWLEKGILPRVPGAEYLECRGFLCQCSLEPTTEPISKGQLPRVP